MDGRGGCCIARYVPGASQVSTVDKIMLRFRPIAPKPAVGATASDGSSSESSDAFLKNGTIKRKYVRDNKYTSKRRIRRRKNTNYSPEQTQKQKQKQKQTTPVVTLPLLPETPDRKDSPAKVLTPSTVRNNNNNNKSKKLNIINKNEPVWMSFENRSLTMMGRWCSCVTVESLTNTWVEGEWLGSTDEERRVNLSKDTCPGFISDGYGRVTWTNEAYEKMMKGDEGQGPVLLVNKVNTVVPHASFTCLVRVVQYACGRERSSLTVPCDVWRMDSGGFAWRLDVKTALSLRLGY